MPVCNQQGSRWAESRLLQGFGFTGSNFSLHQKIRYRPAVQSCLLKILQPEGRQTSPEVARSSLVSDGFRITIYLSNTGIVRSVVHEELSARWVVGRGGLQCTRIQKHRGLINGSFSRNHRCRGWKCVGRRRQAW